MPLPIWQIPFVTLAFISITLYVLIIAVIVIKRKSSSFLKGSYFSLTISQAIAEWAMFIEFMILYRGRKYGYLDSLFKERTDAWDYVPRFSTFIHYYLKIVIYIGQMYFGINRLTAVYKPLGYEKLWTKKRIWSLRLIQYALPLIATLPVAFNYNFDIRYEYNIAQKSLRLIQDNFSTALVAYIDGIASLLATVFCSIIYSIVLTKVSKDMLQFGIEKKRTVELRLAFCAISIFIILILNTAKQLMTCFGTYFDNQNITLLSYDLSYPMIDLLYSITPWALLFTSTEIQRRLTPCIPRKTIPESILIKSTTENRTSKQIIKGN